MKPRARRITIGAAALVAVLVTVLAVANWSTVRDHVEAWHFQLTRETVTIQPVAEGAAADLNVHDLLLDIRTEHIRDVLNAPCPLIFDADDLPEAGYRVLEQRFPRRAYVVIRAAETIPDPPFFETLVIPGQPGTVALSQSEAPLR